VHPVVAPGGPAPGGELLGPDAALGGPQQQVAQLPAEGVGGQRRSELVGPADGALTLDVAAQQRGEDGVLLGRDEGMTVPLLPD